MGFVRQKFHDLWFEGEEFDGLEIKCRSVSIGMFLRACELTPIKVTDKADFTELSEIIADTFVSWNLEDGDGVPIPCDLEHLLEQDRYFVGAIIDAWINSMAGHADPLEHPEKVVDLPMEPLADTA